MRREVPPPEEWDGGEWVDVGPDGRWRPSAGERFRAIGVLGVVLGALALLTVVLSVGGGDEEPDGDVAAATSTTEPEAATSSTTTTAPPDPASVGGQPPPPPCTADDRGAAPLREVQQVVVRVLNGTSRGGHAGAVSDSLQDAGYRVLEPSNADLLPVTRLDHQAGSCAEAHAMLAVLGIAGAELHLVEPGSAAATATPRADVTVTLGRDSL